jgi:hypothetical protein
MDQTRLGICKLARASTPLKLQVDFVQHADPAGANWVTKTLETPIDLARNLAVGIKHAV